MKNTETYFVLKHLYTGLFWNEDYERWEMPFSVVGVYMLKYWTSEQDALDYFNRSLLYIPATDHKDVIISKIVVETNIIF